jgi:hypothetical protein
MVNTAWCLNKTEVTTMQANQKQPKGYWQEQVSLWKASGLSAAAFCKQNNLAYKTFFVHKRKSDMAQGKKFPMQFVQALPITPPVKNAPAMLQLVLPNGIRMGLTPDLDLSWIQKVLSVVGDI